VASCALGNHIRVSSDAPQVQPGQVERKRGRPASWALVAVAALLAAAALVAQILWALYPRWDFPFWFAPIAAVAALLASALAVAVARSHRPFVVLAVASFVAACITLALWWEAVWDIAESS
jgi:hypothetical protein